MKSLPLLLDVQSIIGVDFDKERARAGVHNV